MSRKRVRLFLDSDVLTAGIVSTRGLDKAVLSLCAARTCRLVLAEVVRDEVGENLQFRLNKTDNEPDTGESLGNDYARLIALLKPEIVPRPGSREVRAGLRLTPEAADVPVLVSAIASRPDWFLTYDSHFTPALARRTGLRFATPAEFFRALSLSISSPGAEWNAEWNRDTEPCIEPAGSGRSARAAAVYIFVSKQEEAGSGASLDAQRKRIEGYLKASGLHARMPLVETGASGAEPLEQRTWGMGLFDLIGKGKVRHVVAMNVGSLFRSARDMVTTIAKWDKAGVVLHVMDFCGQTMNTGSPAGRMLLSMANTLLELDRSRITRAIASRKRIGGVYGPMPYGYRKYAGNLFPERMESIALEHMRRLRAEGLSLNAIVRFLNEVEAPSKRGGKWYPTTVKKILARQITLPGDPWLES